MEEYGHSISQFVRAARKKRKWSQEYLAKLTGFKDRQYVWAIEADLRPAPYGFCFLLLEYLDKDEQDRLIEIAKHTARHSLLIKRSHKRRKGVLSKRRRRKKS